MCRGSHNIPASLQHGSGAIPQQPHLGGFEFDLPPSQAIRVSSVKDRVKDQQTRGRIVTQPGQVKDQQIWECSQTKNNKYLSLEHPNMGVLTIHGVKHKQC
jgi:hypothetical protein